MESDEAAALDRDEGSDASGAPDVDNLQRALGVRLNDPALLELALTHRSRAAEAGGLATNERLEFLGDAVLGLVVADQLYNDLPDAPEGRLAVLRAAAVNARSLASIARQLDLGARVRLGRGEERSGGRNKESILADTLEALLGAVYLDRGLGAAADVIARLFGALLEEITARKGTLDAKTSLQELLAARGIPPPLYELEAEGPDHAKRFAATVLVGGIAFGRGEGRSKKEAEQAAAGEALSQLEARNAVGSGGSGGAQGPSTDGCGTAGGQSP